VRRIERHTDDADVGRLDAHRRHSSLFWFYCSSVAACFDFIRLETAPTQSEMFDEKSSTAGQ